MMKRNDAAKQWFLKALQEDANNANAMLKLAEVALEANDSATAQTYIDRLLALPSDDTSFARNLQWARQQKATMLSASGSYDDFQQAVALLEQNKNDLGELAGKDLEQWLTIHASRPEHVSRDKALRKLESLNSDRPLTVVENVILAGLYRTSNRWSDAKSIMLRALSKNSSDPFLIRTYVQWLIEQRDTESSAIAEARTWVSKLNPNSVEALHLSSLLLVLDGKSKQAAQKLLALAPKDIPKEQAPNLKAVAVLCNDLGKYNSQFYALADEQWNRYRKMVPGAMIEYIQFLLNVPGGAQLNKGVAASNKLVNRAVQAGKWNEVLTYITVNIAGLQSQEENLTNDSPHFATVRKWINQVRSARKADESVLTWHEISIADLEDDKKQVESLYRKYLSMSGTPKVRKGIVLNNLSYLLATDGRGDEAISIIDDAIQLLGERSDLQDTRAMALIAANRYADAIQELKGIIDQGEGNAQILFHLALAQKNAGKSADATESMKQSIEQGLTAKDLSKQEGPMFLNLLRELGITVPTSTE